MNVIYNFIWLWPLNKVKHRLYCTGQHFILLYVMFSSTLLLVLVFLITFYYFKYNYKYKNIYYFFQICFVYLYEYLFIMLMSRHFLDWIKKEKYCTSWLMIIPWWDCIAEVSLTPIYPSNSFNSHFTPPNSSIHLQFFYLPAFSKGNDEKWQNVD